MEPVALPPGPAHGHADSRPGPHRKSYRTFSARHERTFYALGWIVSLLLLLPGAARANAVGAVNRARTTHCGFSRAAHPPLSESRGLDAAARLLAYGESLEQAELRTGYRAERSLWIRISGATDDAAIERAVSGRLCAQLANPKLRHIGVYANGAGSLWIVIAEPFTTPRIRNTAAVSRLVLALTNEARAHARSCGWRHFPPAPPLSLAPALTRAAGAHSQDMAAHGFLSHAGSDGSTPGERATRAGYRWSMVGENIASGVETPRAAVAGWLASPHHCANIMTAGFRQMGVAFAVNRANPQVIAWTEDFGRPR